MGFGEVLERARLFSTNTSKPRRKGGDAPCLSCGAGSFACERRAAATCEPCCASCWHQDELVARETRSYYSGAERVEHADGLALAISALPELVRRAWALRYGGLEWQWRKVPVDGGAAELKERLEGDWYRVAFNVVSSQFKVYATFEAIGRELGVSLSTARLYVKRAEEAIAKAWI